MGGVISYVAGLSSEKDDDKKDSVDWLNLPCPVKYEAIQREALESLNPESLEGFRFDYTHPLSARLSEKFTLSHSVFMGSVEVPAQSSQTVKVSASNYEFGANFIDSRMMLIGRISTLGSVMARLKYDFTDSFTVNVDALRRKELQISNGAIHFDYKGKDYQTQVQLQSNNSYCLNYIKSITPTVSLGGEVFWIGHQRKSGYGFAGRYNGDKVIATAQVVTSGMASLTYIQRMSDKLSLVSDLMYNWMSKEATASVGYDFSTRTGRLRGKFDTNGCVATYLEERLNVGVTVLLSAKIDHWKQDYKFGFGMSLQQ